MAVTRARSLWCAAITALCFSCNEPGDQCGYLDDGYTPLEGALWQLPEMPRDRVPASVISGIQKCWAKNPFQGSQYRILLRDARQAPSGRYYVAFEPLDITDTWLVFLVEPGGKVIDGYRYSFI